MKNIYGVLYGALIQRFPFSIFIDIFFQRFYSSILNTTLQTHKTGGYLSKKQVK